MRGVSMEPTYRDGDVLLVVYGVAPRVGATHVVRLPDGPDGPRPLAVKRITRQDGTDHVGRPTWWVERDNPREGVDSWLVGALPDVDVRGRVLARVPPRILRGLRRRRTLAGVFRRGSDTR